jgi:hypothetical protein
LAELAGGRLCDAPACPANRVIHEVDATFWRSYCPTVRYRAGYAFIAHFGGKSLKPCKMELIDVPYYDHLDTRFAMRPAIRRKHSTLYLFAIDPKVRMRDSRA